MCAHVVFGAQDVCPTREGGNYRVFHRSVIVMLSYPVQKPRIQNLPRNPQIPSLKVLPRSVPISKEVGNVQNSRGLHSHNPAGSMMIMVGIPTPDSRLHVCLALGRTLGVSCRLCKLLFLKLVCLAPSLATFFGTPT
jgi:hypothetical protein